MKCLLILSIFNLVGIAISESSLRGGQQLDHNQFIYSPNGCFKLIMQEDGNLVLYRVNGPGGDVWSTRTYNTGAIKAVMQDDGNLVVYNHSGSVWSSKTYGNHGAYLDVQNDGNLVIYAYDRNVLWKSDSVTFCG